MPEKKSVNVERRQIKKAGSVDAEAVSGGHQRQKGREWVTDTKELQGKN